MRAWSMVTFLFVFVRGSWSGIAAAQVLNCCASLFLIYTSAQQFRTGNVAIYLPDVAWLFKPARLRARECERGDLSEFLAARTCASCWLDNCLACRAQRSPLCSGRWNVELEYEKYCICGRNVRKQFMTNLKIFHPSKVSACLAWGPQALLLKSERNYVERSRASRPDIGAKRAAAPISY